MQQWIVTYPTPTSVPSVRLFCVPFAGGTAAAYSSWRSLLPSQIQLCVVGPRGIDALSTRPEAATVEAMADSIADAMRPLLDRPYIMFGHSLGAALAYEVTARLEQVRRRPLHLFVSARRGPHAPSALPPIAHLGDETFLQELQTRYGGIPRTLLEEPEVMALLLPRLRSDVRMNEDYSAAPRPVACPIWALGGAGDRMVSPEELDTWAACTRADFHRYLLPGGHFFIQDSPARVVALVCDALQNAPALSGSAP